MSNNNVIFFDNGSTPQMFVPLLPQFASMQPDPGQLVFVPPPFGCPPMNLQQIMLLPQHFHSMEMGSPQFVPLLPHFGSLPTELSQFAFLPAPLESSLSLATQKSSRTLKASPGVVETAEEQVSEERAEDEEGNVPQQLLKKFAFLPAPLESSLSLDTQKSSRTLKASPGIVETAKEQGSEERAEDEEGNVPQQLLKKFAFLPAPLKSTSPIRLHKSSMTLQISPRFVEMAKEQVSEERAEEEEGNVPQQLLKKFAFLPAPLESSLSLDTQKSSRTLKASPGIVETAKEQGSEERAEDEEGNVSQQLLKKFVYVPPTQKTTPLPNQQHSSTPVEPRPDLMEGHKAQDEVSPAATVIVRPVMEDGEEEHLLAEDSLEMMECGSPSIKEKHAVVSRSETEDEEEIAGITGLADPSEDSQTSCSGSGSKDQVRQLEKSEKHLFKCQTCALPFDDVDDLAEHVQTHTKKRPFKCNVCGASFPYPCAVTDHMRTHTGERPFGCTVCSKTFAVRGNLKVHMRTHTGVRPFKCSMCSASFMQKSSLTKHTLTHTVERPFVCGLCGASFVHKCRLRVHIQNHTGERPFQCSVCSAPLMHKSSLTKHMRTHNERHLSCDVCHAIFDRKSRLAVHMLTHSVSSTLSLCT